jgi:hypothetical protein
VGITIDGDKNADCNPKELLRLDYILTCGKMTPKSARVLHNPWVDLYTTDVGSDGMIVEGKTAMDCKRGEERGKCFSDHSAVVGTFTVG